MQTFHNHEARVALGMGMYGKLHGGTMTVTAF